MGLDSRFFSVPPLTELKLPLLAEVLMVHDLLFGNGVLLWSCISYFMMKYVIDFEKRC